MFPTLVYRCPGVHQRAGGTYDYRQAVDEEALAALIEAGWFATLPEAIAGKVDVPKELEKAGAEAGPDDNANDDDPPNRAELEQKAQELGIEFSPRLGDKKLAALIDAHLAG